MQLTKVLGACSLGAAVTFHPVIAFAFLGAAVLTAFAFAILLRWFARQPHAVRKDVVALIRAMRPRR